MLRSSGGQPMKNYIQTFSRASLFIKVQVAVWLLAGTTAAYAQSFDLGGGSTGSVSIGANGPTGVLNNASMAGDAPTIGGAGGFAGGPASMGDAGTIGRTSFRTGVGNQAMGGFVTGPTDPAQNPFSGPGNNFGMSNTTTGLMAPYSVDNAPMPVSATNSGHMDYGFTAGPQQYYDSMYGLTRAGNNLIDDLGRRFTGGFITSGRQSLPRVSTGSVDINTVTRGSAGFGP